MSKITIVGGDIIESIGGKDLSFAREDIVNSSDKQVIMSGKESGVSYGMGIKNEIYIGIKKAIRLEITDEVTGYTIQELKGLSIVDYTFHDPAVIVATYKVNILDIVLENDKIIKSEKKGEFNVTRDAWYCLGENDKGNYELLNRAFIPDSYSRNLYGLFWIPSYPNVISSRLIRSNLGAFIFTRFGSRKIPAKPLDTQTKLNGDPIDSPRKDVNFATDVMIHVGGTYEVLGYDHLGGSYGCFGFIPIDDIYSSPELAEKASENDDYDDESSNKEWKKIVNFIIKLSFETKKDLQVILNERDENEVYYPEKVLAE